MHIGFIRYNLPNAVFIDARRNALDCCFSAFSKISLEARPLAMVWNEWGIILKNIALRWITGIRSSLIGS